MELELDWNKCAAAWGELDCITGGMTGPMLAPTAAHLSCEDFAKKHPDSFEFLLQKLYEPNPILAGYAFKCLIRVSHISLKDLPAEVLSRSERVNVQQGGCVVQEMTLGQYFRGYWGLPLVEEWEIYYRFRPEDQLIEILNESMDPANESDVARQQAARNILARRLRDDIVPPRSPSA